MRFFNFISLLLYDMKKIDQRNRNNVLWQYVRTSSYVFVVNCIIFSCLALKEFISLSQNYQLLMLYLFYGFMLSLLALIPFIGLNSIWIWIVIVQKLNTLYPILFEYRSGVNVIIFIWLIIIVSEALFSSVLILFMSVFKNELRKTKY